MTITPTFVLSNQAVKNSHGFYLQHDGGDFNRFYDNPVMLADHDTKALIGKWIDLRTQGNELLANAEFDPGDELALKYQGKVARGYLKGASLGIVIRSAEWRTNPVSGEEELHVTKWELIEGSIVSVPSNAGALSLAIYDDALHPVALSAMQGHLDTIVKLSAGSQKTDSKTFNIKKMEQNQNQLSAEAQVALGVSANGTDMAAVSAAIVRLKADLNTAGAALLAMQDEAKKVAEKAADDLVSLAVKDGRITADKKDAFLKLATADFPTAKATLEAIPGKQTLGAAIVPLGSSAIPSDRKDWTLLQWMKCDMSGLDALKASDPDAYAKIKR